MKKPWQTADELKPSFFARPALKVAEDLVRCTLVAQQGNNFIFTDIYETGAYEGGKITARREGMNDGPGTIFLMPYRGNLFLNIATGNNGIASCVQIRGLIATVKSKRLELLGPGKLTKHLGISREIDSQPLGEKSNLWILPYKGYPGVGFVMSDPKKVKDKGMSENCLAYFRTELE